MLTEICFLPNLRTGLLPRLLRTHGGRLLKADVITWCECGEMRIVIAASLSVVLYNLQSSLAHIISSDGWNCPVRSGGQIIMISVKQMI